MTETTGVMKPGDTLGILGGGQLGRMIAMAAARLGVRTVVLEPDPKCPAEQVASHHIAADYDNMEALELLARECRAVTYEFENIPAGAARFLDERGLLFPGTMALEKSQDRLAEKEFIRQCGAQTAPFHAIASDLDLLKLCEGGFDGILKTRRFGYDGKGQVRITPEMSREDLERAFASLKGAESILEGFVDFDCEISVIAARSRDGEIRAYDPARNIHRDGILDTSRLPSGVPSATIAAAKEIASDILSALDYVGVVGIEFFVLRDGSLVVNEMAPRVHNSGHWTEAACAVSQFEQHVRAVCGWPLGDPSRHSDCIMENLIGQDVDRFDSLLGKPGLSIHLYGKSETRPGRKMGHFTRLTGPAS